MQDQCIPTLCACGCEQPLLVYRRPHRFLRNHNKRRGLPEHFWAKVNREGPIPAHQPDLGPCWLWTGYCQEFGYGALRWIGKSRLAHPVAYELSTGSIPEGLFVLHHCDNPPCCNPNHLFVGTRYDNAIDAARKGRMGRKRPGVPLSEESIRAIRELAGTMTQATIAAQFGITQTHAGRIIQRKHWSHVE